ncbi:Sec-independent protein translocase protein TatB [Lysobacter xanthus]
MFDIGFSELLVIALVALVVLGPERLPKAARMAGLWVRRARAQWHSVKSELENELADEDMRRSIQRARDELREAQEALRADGARLRTQLADVEARMAEPPDATCALPPERAVDPDALDAQRLDVEADATRPGDAPSRPDAA